MITINLLPSKRKKGVVIPPSAIYGAVALVALIIITVVLTLYLNKQIATLKNDIVTKEQRLKRVFWLLLRVSLRREIVILILPLLQKKPDTSRYPPYF